MTYPRKTPYHVFYALPVITGFSLLFIIAGMVAMVFLSVIGGAIMVGFGYVHLLAYFLTDPQRGHSGHWVRTWDGRL
jgi:hypothetical protein